VDLGWGRPRRLEASRASSVRCRFESLRRLNTERSPFEARTARLAPFGYAQTVDVEIGEDLVGSGRLVVLHDPAGQPTWEGTTRVIAYIDADVDLEVAADPVLPEVGWAWLNEALTESNAEADALGGTVTQVFSRSFGVMESREPEGRLQVRASWTPADPSTLIPHARAWALLTASACGLTPNSEGVTNLNRHR
jgi:hypothetical protein